MSDLDTTLALFGDRLVLLQGKRPFQRGWPTLPAPSAKTVRAHGNVGIRAGDGLVILDWDRDDLRAAMFAKLGPLPLNVVTGRGRHHSYVAHRGPLPATIEWGGERVGEILATRERQACAPPSRHPDTNRPYQWLGTPEPTELPEAWQSHFDGSLPGFINASDRRGVPRAEAWDGPSAEAIIEAALRQPGARRRSGGHIKARCFGCHLEGHDRHQDNLVVWPDGRWGCAHSGKAHSVAIARQLGVSR